MTMTYVCPKGHASADPDYCSECGIRLLASTGHAEPGAATVSARDCPDCATPRVPGARFCEVCRFDFANVSSGPAPGPFVQPPPPSNGPAAPAPAVPTLAVLGPSDGQAEVGSAFYGKNAWAVVTAERRLASTADAAAFPADEPARSYPLDFAENLVGRRNARAGVHPEVPVNDPSVSSRHLKFCRRPTGMVLIDVGSTNGTKVNGAPVQAGVEVVVAPGDQVELGAWTRIVLEAR